MDDRYWCGEILRHAYESWRCIECRRACCPACAEVIDGNVHCLRCTRGRADAAA